MIRILIVILFNASFISTQSFRNQYECLPDKVSTDQGKISKVIYKEGKLFGRVETFVQLPQIGQLEGKITCIMVEDLSLKKRGAYISTIGGGLGDKYVILAFRSQSGSPVQYLVTVYYETAPATTAATTV